MSRKTTLELRLGPNLMWRLRFDDDFWFSNPRIFMSLYIILFQKTSFYKVVHIDQAFKLNGCVGWVSIPGISMLQSCLGCLLWAGLAEVNHANAFLQFASLISEVRFLCLHHRWFSSAARGCWAPVCTAPAAASSSRSCSAEPSRKCFPG